MKILYKKTAAIPPAQNNGCIKIIAPDKPEITKLPKGTPLAQIINSNSLGSHSFALPA
jgi:hypothetical protein